MRRYHEGWRAAVLSAAVITAAALTVITESLSLFQALSFYPLIVIWLLLCALAGLKAFYPVGGQLPAWPQVNFKNWFLSEKVFLVIIIFIGVVTAITASVGVPNTWDSMTYHLARVEHWIQDRTVGFFPTHIMRQLYYSPWAEFAIAQLRILGGGQTSPNFVQWAAMAGSLIGVSLIAGQLGANRKGQWLAATIAACLPMGILQSVSTQTDYACAFWLTVFVYFLFETQRQFILVNSVAAGLSLGLALLTKGNSYVFALPFLAWFFAKNFKQQFSQGLLGLLLMIVCAVSLNAGQYLRSTQTFGSPMGASSNLIDGAFDFKVLWVNVLRNMSVQLASPLTDVNENITQTMTKAAQFFGADINDPRASLGGDFSVSGISMDEDYSGNFFHAVLFGIVFVLVWFYQGPRGRIGFYAGIILSSFLLFCLIVRFQPWNSRFHLPLLILFCPVAGVVLEGFLKQKSVVLGILLFLGAMPWLFLNDQHPWSGPQSIWKQPQAAQYFYKRPYLALPIVESTAYIKSVGCRQIGLLLGEDTWEYPWWVFLAGKGVRIEHVGVNNASASLKYPLGDFQACAIIVSGVQAPPLLMVGSAIYGPAGSIPAGDDKVTIFLKKY